MTETGSWQITRQAEAGSAALRLVVIVMAVSEGLVFGFPHRLDSL